MQRTLGSCVGIWSERSFYPPSSLPLFVIVCLSLSRFAT